MSQKHEPEYNDLRMHLWSTLCTFAVHSITRPCMYDEQIKLKVDSPKYQFAKESVSPTLLPHAQPIKRLKNSYLLAFIFWTLAVSCSDFHGTTMT